MVVRRFDKTNSAYAAEEAVLLGRGAYVAIRAQLAPGAAVVARSDFSATLYQAVGKESEIIPSVRVMTFPDGKVRILGIGAGRYAGLWYLGGRTSVAIQKGEQAVTSTAQVRRYQADASPNFINASVSMGREIVALGENKTELQRTSSFAARGQKLVSRNVGVGLGFTYETIKALPDRRGFTLSSFLRW
jgi:YaiO family outer membrane protein